MKRDLSIFSVSQSMYVSSNIFTTLHLYLNEILQAPTGSLFVIRDLRQGGVDVWESVHGRWRFPTTLNNELFTLHFKNLNRINVWNVGLGVIVNVDELFYMSCNIPSILWALLGRIGYHLSNPGTVGVKRSLNFNTILIFLCLPSTNSRSQSSVYVSHKRHLLRNWDFLVRIK